MMENDNHENTNKENNRNMTRREFLRSLGLGAVAFGGAIANSGCKDKEQEEGTETIPIIGEDINRQDNISSRFPNEILQTINEVRANPQMLTDEFHFPDDIAHNLETYFITQNPVLALEVARRLLEQKIVMDVASVADEHFIEYRATGPVYPQYDYDPMVENTILGGTISIQHIGPLSLMTTDEYGISMTPEVSEYGSDVALAIESPQEEIDDANLILDYAIAFGTRPPLDVHMDYDNKTITVDGYRARVIEDKEEDLEL